MSKKTLNRSLGPKALEMVMRDVLGGMEEFSIMKSYESSGEEYKIITIQPYAQWTPKQELYDFEKFTQEPQLAEVIVFEDYLKRKKRNN
ncbi:hypothetical protein MNBD_GAMMA12-3582 [hydrothermal vent metagenome]|uniref:Uncharacterized protein n=1 Tax=hydrothermal vent metagenome TaxID=652676 RepID=A0A3B0YY83_9ZZZZ